MRARLCVAACCSVLLSACVAEDDAAFDEELAEAEVLTWEVAYAAEPDASVAEDLEYLTRGAPIRVVPAGSVDSRIAEDSSVILVEYVGKGQPVESGAAEPPPDMPVDEAQLRREDESPYVSLGGANMVTRNRFRLHVPKAYLDRFADLTPWVDPEAEPPRDLTAQPGAAGPADLDASTSLTLQEPEPQAWSNNYDSRQQIYGTNGGVGGVNRWLVHLSNNCSAAMVGPRHIVTAAHCVTPFAGGGTTWNLEDRVARVGRNGTSDNGSITIDTQNIPPGQVAWWWTSTGWLDGSAPGRSDFSIVTLPGSFGCQSFSGQCNFAYSFTGKGNLQNEAIYTRGYPACDAATYQGGNRIDEPCQNNGQTPAACSNYGSALCTTPCRNRHVYGQAFSCGFGTFSDSGRRFWHGCDVSAGDSGAPVYYNKSGTWTIAGVHYFSACGKSCSESCSGMTTPARATRMTKSRRDTINWFIDNWPNY